MRAIITFGCEFPESLRETFEEVAAHQPVAGLTADDMHDAITSGTNFAIIEIELID